GFGADKDCVTFRPQFMGVLARRCACDPAAFTFRSSDASIKSHSALCDYKRNPGRDPFVERLVNASAFLSQNSGADFDSGILEDFDSAAPMSRIWICRANDN